MIRPKLMLHVAGRQEHYCKQNNIHVVQFLHRLEAGITLTHARQFRQEAGGWPHRVNRCVYVNVNVKLEITSSSVWV